MRDPHALIRFSIPATFVLSRAMPTGAELAYGFDDGWLTRRDVIDIAVAKLVAPAWSRPDTLRPAEEQLAHLTTPEQVEVLVRELEISDEPSERRARLWLYLSLSWVHEHATEFDDPFQVVEKLYTDFDYPEEVTGFVRFMPPGLGEEVGLAAMERRWRRWLDQLGDEYRSRRVRPGE